MEKEQYEIMRLREDSFWWYVGMRRITGKLLEALPRQGSWPRVLDAGCGTGANLSFLSSYGEEVVGIDLAEEALHHCRLRGHQGLAKGLVQELPFADDSFDLVTCHDVIYHERVSDDLAALREFHRVLRQRGVLLIRVPAYDWLRGAHDRAVHTRHRYLRGELRSKLAQAGFRPIRVTHANCLLLPLAIVKRLLESRGIAFGADLGPPLPVLNRLLTSFLALEARLVGKVDLPAGLSVIGIGVKECI